MKKISKTVSTLLFVGVLASIMSGCAEDNYNAGYNSYDKRSNADRKLDYAAQDAAYEASSKLSAQDIKNINNLK